MDKQNFDDDFNDYQNNPLDEAFVIEEGDLGLDDSTIKEESVSHSLMSSIRIKSESHKANIKQPSFMQNMKEWSTDEASKFEAMLNNDKKGHEAAVNISRIGGSKNEQNCSNLKFSKGQKSHNY